MPPDPDTHHASRTAVEDSPPLCRWMRRRMRAAGFTLVELLVAMAVLAMIVVLMAQLLGGASQAARTSGRRMDAESQARIVFDRMAGDFAGMLRRPDADSLFYANAGNEVMYFYSESPAYYDTTVATTNKGTIALIGYRINTNNSYYPGGTPVLERLGKGLLWNDPSGSNTPIFLTTPAGSAVPTNPSTLAKCFSNTLGTPAGGYANGSDTSYQALGESVYRMEIQFLLTDGTLSGQPILTNAPANWPTNATPIPTFYTPSASDPTISSGTPTYTTGSRWWNTTTQRGYICASSASNAAVWTPVGTRDISAVVVTLAILDANSRKLIPAGVAVNWSNLPDSVAGFPVGSSWMTHVTNGTALGGGIPAAASTQVRVFQRTFPLQ